MQMPYGEFERNIGALVYIIFQSHTTTRNLGYDGPKMVSH